MDLSRLDQAIRSGNVPVLLAVLHQLTGDRRWLSPPYTPRRAQGMDDNTGGGLTPDIQAEIRVAAADAVRAWAAGRPPVLPHPRGDALRELLETCMGEPVPPEFEPLMAETLGLDRRGPRTPERRVPTDFSVVVIGAGFSGLAAAIALRAAGIAHVVLEKNDDIGGTWLENRYPGAGVDTPSHLYSLSGAPRAWSTHFGKRDEVHGYLREVADRHALWPSIRLGVEVESADWDATRQRWTVRTDDGATVEANAVISAVGQLNRPRVPALPGLDTFGGTAVHSARWPDDLDVTGKRVAVVGTGASAMQIVPAIADEVAALTVFQRSPQWVAPNANYFRPIGEDEHWLLAEVPYYRAWTRARLAWTFNDKVHPSLRIDPDWTDPGRSVNAVNDAHRRFFTRYLHEQLAGRPDLVAKALPDYPPFGKRMLLDNGWFAALRRDTVELVTEEVAEITPTGVRGAGGEHRDADVLVLCTGFESRRFLHPMRISGRSGHTLSDTWGDEDARAHLGITVPDFPNLFLMLGPNTALGHGGSVITVLEYQLRYIVDLIATLIERGLGSVECRPEVYADYTERVDRAHAAMIWTHPGMTNWYRNAAGRVVNTLPWRIVDYRAMTLRADLGEFIVEPARRVRA